MKKTFCFLAFFLALWLGFNVSAMAEAKEDFAGISIEGPGMGTDFNLNRDHAKSVILCVTAVLREEIVRMGTKTQFPAEAPGAEISC